MTRYYVVSLLLCIAFSLSLQAQNGYVNQDFDWLEKKLTQVDSSVVLTPYTKESIQLRPGEVPFYIQQIPLKDGEELKIDPSIFALTENIDALRYADFISGLAAIPQKIQPTVTYHTARKQRIARIEVPLLEKEANGQIRKLTHLTLKWELVQASKLQTEGKKGVNWKSESLLKDGTWAKVNFAESGIYRLTVGEIEGFGIAARNEDISKIRMYAYAGGMLPEDNSLTVYDDLEEMAIDVRDKNSNGIFDGDDDVLFFAQGPHQLIYNPNNKTFYKQIHLYSDLSAAFITVGAPGGKRIANTPGSANAPTYTTSAFDEILHQEEEKINLIKSGKDWYGKEFGRVTTSHTLNFDLPGQIQGENFKLQTRASARSGSGSALFASVNGQSVLHHSMPSVNVMIYSQPYASAPAIQTSIFKAAGPLSVTLTYSKPDDSDKAWLDFAEIIYRRKLESNGQMLFRESRGVTLNGVTRYDLQGTGYQIWDLSDPLNVSRLNLNNDGGNDYFVAESSILREYAALKNETYKGIHSFEKISNQNIHGKKNIDYVIVAHPDFLAEAKRLADFHQNTNGLTVLVVEPREVYNEFSSGVPDISAIRNMMRYFYATASPGNEPRYLLLFGDASYDYKNILNINSNFVPTFESKNSVEPVGSYCSDDFFGLLDENEGGDINYSGYLDVGMGRLPVQTPGEAKAMVDKIIRYHSVEGLGDWRNVVAMLTDDEDGNIHMHDGIEYSKIIERDHPEYNVRKLFSDAYKQTTIGNGQRYPDVIKEVDRAFNEGALIVNYSGHGGEIQLGAEKYVDIPQINSWNGGANLPLFITATCEFTRFDDPARQSAGELVMLNPTGGGIGLLTTVRLVFQWPNRQLNTSFYEENAFTYPPDQVPALGDLLVKTKNDTPPNINSRSFVFLGDPAVKLAYPKYNVAATAINGVDIDVQSDTLQALTHFTIDGEVQDFQSQLLSSFNGTVYTTVFASKQEITTLANDPDSYEETFEAYTSIVYKGKASVKNGVFKVEFILPRDLPFKIGEAKISFYAENGIEDANGFETFMMSPVVDPNAPLDFTGPEIRLFMNDSNFVFGGITDENPFIYALIHDESGINTTGIGIGRDISGILDNNTKEVYVLNEYYDAYVDDFTSGSVRYPLKGLKEGRHTLRVKVWDVHNNSAEATTEFIVAPSVDFAIYNLMSYPNPFTSSTTISFEHNQQGKNLDIQVYIYDTKGNLVKTLSALELSAGSRVNSLVWNPYRDGVTEVLPGMYLFKLIVRSEDGKEIQESSRFVYLPNP